MLFGVQILGILFALVMIYFTFLYFKRNTYTKQFFLLWILVWVGFLVLIWFPATIYGVMELLEIENTADFFVIIGFIFFAISIFYMFIITKKNEQKVEALVRSLAIREAKSKKKKK